MTFNRKERGGGIEPYSSFADLPGVTWVASSASPYGLENFPWNVILVIQGLSSPAFTKNKIMEGCNPLSYIIYTQIAFLCQTNVGIGKYGWPMVGVGSTTLVQHCPYVNNLSLAVGSITGWNQYVGPTLGQCTPMACFNMTEL